MDDLVGMFGDGTTGTGVNGNSKAGSDLMNGFSGLRMDDGQPPPSQTQGGKKTNEDLLGLF